MSSSLKDVIIIGAGPMGSTLALGLAQRGVNVVLVDARDPSAEPRRDGRNFAVVSGSWTLLERIGITDALLETSEPLLGLEAVDGGTHFFGAPSVLFKDDDLGDNDGAPLGYMVMAEPLQRALDHRIAENTAIEVLAPALFSSVECKSGSNRVKLEDGRNIETRLLIGCDGVNSPVRTALDIRTEGRDYQKSVFTANVKLSQPHFGLARQLFTPEGPFATLPLKGDRANLAWYMKRGAAEALVAMGKTAAEAELNARFAEFSGGMEIEGEAGSYPLILQLARSLTGSRAALVGDAVRRVNPLAGQGLNQGMRDVAALIEVIEDAMRLGLDIGSGSVLERYSQARHFDGHSSALALDGIDRLFSNDLMITKPVRTLGLLAADGIPPIRRFLARMASAHETGVPRLMRRS
ncbi:MAG: FAD-dependent oxidoreductase [Pseudomonadota bacterium]